jgi:hypothetical protein
LPGENHPSSERTAPIVRANRSWSRRALGLALLAERDCVLPSDRLVLAVDRRLVAQTQEHGRIFLDVGLEQLEAYV